MDEEEEGEGLVELLDEVHSVVVQLGEVDLEE